MGTTADEAADYSGVADVSVSELRDNLSATIDRVDRDDTFIYLTRNGRRIAAIMPADIAENYERIEDDYWARRAAEARDETSRPLGEVIADLESTDR